MQQNRIDRKGRACYNKDEKSFSERKTLMKKIRIGVLGAYRGTSMINYCKKAENAEIVAICDKSPSVLEKHHRLAEGCGQVGIGKLDSLLPHVVHGIDKGGFQPGKAHIIWTAFHMGYRKSITAIVTVP